MKKHKFKKMVKKALIDTVLHYFESKKGSKSAKLESENLDIQPYLKSQTLTVNEKKLLFKLRSSMIIIENNYNGKGRCKLCGVEQSLQTHLITCIFIKGVNSEVRLNPNLRGVKESDVFSNDIIQMKNAALLFKAAIRASEILHEYFY